MTKKPSLTLQTVQKRLLDLKPLETNARFMNAAQFDRLVKNLEEDGVLTSTPLIYKDKILSGNHRVKAAIKAGIETANFLEILNELTEEEQTKIILSHNAIDGQDDINILKAMYDTLSIDSKAYSGLTDDSFKISEIDISALSIGGPRYDEIMLLFLPTDRQVFIDALKKLDKSKASVQSQKARDILCSPREDFDALFNTLTQVKGKMNIYNTSIALIAMAELAMAQLEYLESQT